MISVFNEERKEVNLASFSHDMNVNRQQSTVRIAATEFYENAIYLSQLCATAIFSSQLRATASHFFAIAGHSANAVAAHLRRISIAMEHMGGFFSLDQVHYMTV